MRSARKGLVFYMTKREIKCASVLRLSVLGLLIAIGFIIPMFSPLKIVLEPASFTLASHVPVFIAMFISPIAAIAVAVGTTIGFFFAFPLVVALRAATHIIFAALGALYLKKAPAIFASALNIRIFSFAVALVHAVCEVAAVSAFYVGGAMTEAYYEKGFFTSVFLLVGLGTIVHSMVDFEIALIIKYALRKQVRFEEMAGKKL